ncbi:MAG: thymidylate synthase, partial [bacterium]|nr:thymidylate synthase [bacterium]
LPKGGSREITGAMLKFDMANGFPVLTERDLRKAFRGAIGEIVAFINGATTLEELEKFGCPRMWWEKWVSKEKCELFGLKEHDLGRGSYGGSLGKFHTRDGREFDQVQAVQSQIRKMPFLRTHVLSTWNPPYSMGDPDQGCPREVVVAPCHGNFVHFTLFDADKEIQMTHVQRSADVPVGLQFNIIEWAALGMMLAHILGYKFTHYTHFISNPHYYGVQNEAVEELLSREPRRFPTVTLRPNRKVERLQDFRPEDFILEDDYDPHPWLGIPTPI